MALKFEEFEQIAGVARTIESIEKGTANLNGITIDVKVVTFTGGKQGMINLERYNEFKKACVKNDAGEVEVPESWKVASPRPGLTVGFLYDSEKLTGSNTGNSLSIG
jgi:hypothetical protein